MSDQANTDLANVDVAAITRDEEMVEALGLGLPVVADTPADFELAQMLVDWRQSVHAGPVDNPITVDDVEHAIAASAAAQRKSRSTGRHLRLVAGAAAVIGVALGGLTIMSEGAHPGDPLWNVKKVVYPTKAVQTQASYDAQLQIASAEKALAAGKPADAKAALKRAQASLTPIANQQDRAPLDAAIGRLTASAEAAIKAATPAPPKKLPPHRPIYTPPPVTDYMPRFTPPPVPQPQYTPPPVQRQVPAPEPQPEYTAPPAPRPKPRGPISILPN